MKLPLSFYQRNDVVQISKELIGKVLITEINGFKCSGRIVETEAYQGPEDRGSHAFGNRLTPRTENMFKDGGITYVYQCYGIHYLLNVVTSVSNSPHAILLRGLEPIDGIETMLFRRKMKNPIPALTAGPGVLAQAMGIDKSHNGISLLGDKIWIEEPINETVCYDDIVSSKRVGMNFEGPWHSIPWRFRLKNNLYTSQAR